MRRSFLPIWDVSWAWTFPRCFVFLTTPSSLFMESVLYTGCWVMHLEGTGHDVFSPVLKCHLKSPSHSCMSRSRRIFCVYVSSVLPCLHFWMFYKTVNAAPPLEGWGQVQIALHAISPAASRSCMNTGAVRCSHWGAQLSWTGFSRRAHGSWNDGRPLFSFQMILGVQYVFGDTAGSLWQVIGQWHDCSCIIFI